jgi:hypothetical protein
MNHLIISVVQSTTEILVSAKAFEKNAHVARLLDKHFFEMQNFVFL